MFLILTYLLLFYWIPEKSLWDKILAAFGAVLVVQIWCVAFDLSWLGERAANKMWNYSLLSCSIWILILFFDFRVSLHKSRRVYVGTDSANKTFYWYLLVHVILLLMAVPFYNHDGLPKFGHPKHENLLQTSSWTAFCGSATLFLVTFCILLETIDKLFRDHQLYSSRRCLNLSARLILAMVLIWMIVSLSLLIRWSSSGMANWLLYSLHLLQAVIYIVFTYNEIKQRVQGKLNYFLFGRQSGEYSFRQLSKDDDRVPILTIQLDTEPRRTENATFYTGTVY